MFFLCERRRRRRIQSAMREQLSKKGVLTCQGGPMITSG